MRRAPSKPIKSASSEGSGKGTENKDNAHMNENVTMEPITAYAIFQKRLMKKGTHFLKDIHY